MLGKDMREQMAMCADAEAGNHPLGQHQALHSRFAVPPPIMPLALLDSWRTASKMLSEMMAKSVRQLGRSQNLSW